MMILNKEALENWVEPITHELEFQLQTPFLLYRSKKSEYYLLIACNKKIIELLKDIILSLSYCSAL